MHAQQQRDGVVRLILRRGGILVHLERIEVLELVQAEQALFPHIAVVNLALFEQQLAADDRVAGDSVAGEFDARNIEGLALIDVDVEKEHLLGFIEARCRVCYKVDVAEGAVSLTEIVEAFANGGVVEVVAVLDGELGAQGLHVPYVFIAGERDATQPIASAFFDRQGDVDALALLGPEGQEREPALIPDMRGRLSDNRLEVAMILIGHPNPFGVLFQLAGVIGAGEEVLQEDGVRNADGTQVAHGIAQGTRVQVSVAGKADVAHFNCRAFLDIEGDRDRSGRDGLDIRRDGRELVPMLAQQCLQDCDRPRDPGRVVLALHTEPDLLLLKPVKHIRLRDGVETLVIDLADGGLFTYEDVENFALGGVFLFNADVFEVAGVPERVEVTLHGCGVVIVPDVRIEAGEDRFLGDAAVADDPDLRDDVAVLRECGRNGAEEYCQSTQPLKRQFTKDLGTNGLVLLDLGAHAPPNDGKNRHTLTATKIELPLFRAGKPIL